MKKLVLIIIAISSVLNVYLKAEDNSDWKIGGQVQLRSEIDGRDFSNRTRTLNFTSMRTRVSVLNSSIENLGFFVQIQDSRIFGSEPKTLASTSNLDIHQAFVTMKVPLDIPVFVKAGRFEMSYGTQRFLGAVGWHYVARSFDGVLFSFDPGVKIDVFALTHKDPQGYIGNAKPAFYPDTLLPNNSYSIYGFWANKEINKSNTVDLFAYYESDRVKSNGTDPNLAMATIGVNHKGNYGSLSTIFEGGYQTGANKGIDVAAYLVSLQASYKIGTFSVGAGGDVLSGTDPVETDAVNAFSPSYATNHKFYGYMDYFINVPGNTNNLGLRDFYFMLKWNPENSKFNAGANFHLMMSDKNDADGKNNFGNELDLTLKYKFTKGTTIIWGGSVFLQGDLMKNKFNSEKFEKTDPAFWTYLMITANIN